MNVGDCKEAGGALYGLMLFALAESSKATRVLEIGTGWGHSGRSFAESLKLRDDSELVTVDPKNRVSVENAIAIRDSGIKWTRIDSKSGDARPDGTFDLLYIDGDPAQAKMDYERFGGQVRDGGLIVFDGYGGQPGPTEAVESLDLPFTCLEYSAPFCFAIHRRPCATPTYKDLTNKARCSNCEEVMRDESWTGLESKVNAHIEKSRHTVDVFIPTRSIRYKKGAR